MGSDSNHIVATYALCTILVILYASARFNTPATNRSSTVQSWYWQGLLAYIVSSITLFGVLSVVLEQPALRDFLLKSPLPADPGTGGPPAPPSRQIETVMSIPPALAATLVMTTLLPSVPYIKTFDSALLAFFLRMACIPAEVTRRSKILTHQNLRLANVDLGEIRSFIQNNLIPNEATEFVRASAETAWEESELRFTKVLLVFCRLEALQERPRYSKFFDENAVEYHNFRDSMIAFATRATKGLTTARRLRDRADEGEYEELIRDKREAFKIDCIERFAAASLFLARAILQCELNERDVRARLRDVGFDMVSVNRPFIPIHQLAGLCVGILVYLLLIGTILHPPVDDQRAAEFRWVPFLIALAHVLTIGVTLWFMQTVRWARRADDGTRPIASYLLCGFLGTATALLLCVLWDLARVGAPPDRARLLFLLPFGIICGLLCVIVAFAADDRPPRVPEPLWFRCLEALGCALALALAASLLMQLFPPASGVRAPPRLIGALLPGGTALVVGFFIPAIYRAGLRRADDPDPVFAPVPLS